MTSIVTIQKLIRIPEITCHSFLIHTLFCGKLIHMILLFSNKRQPNYFISFIENGNDTGTYIILNLFNFNNKYLQTVCPS